MEGYEVRTSDDEKVGVVVATIGENLIVEHGTLFKSRRPLPLAFADVDERERIVRATVPKDVFEDAPKVEDGTVDERAVAQHYGLAAGETQPETLGYGELTADDPARTAEEDMRRAGITPAYEKGTQSREDSRPGQPTPTPSSPGLLGERKPPPPD